MIRVEHLTRRFANVKAVDDVSFDVSRGEIVGLLGPNGAGKTTIMRILAGYIAPSSGKVYIDNLDMSRQSRKTKSLIGYLPENNPLYEDMRVVEYLKYRAGLYGIPSEKLKSNIRFVLERCWISDVAHRVIGTLSKGYRQRVGLASALIGNPKILILDEPTVGLDPNQIIEARKLIRELASEHTILFSTHILSEVEMIAQKVLILNHGQIVASNTTQSLRDGGLAARTIILEIKGSSQEVLIQKLLTLPGVDKVKHETADDGYERFIIFTPSDKDLRADIYQAFKTDSCVIRQLVLEKQTLEDVFVAMTNQNKQESIEEVVS